jgi:hypothetical protein
VPSANLKLRTVSAWSEFSRGMSSPVGAWLLTDIDNKRQATDVFSESRIDDGIRCNREKVSSSRFVRERRRK